MSQFLLLMVWLRTFLFVFFFFNDTATTEIYTLSLHDALPICLARPRLPRLEHRGVSAARSRPGARRPGRSEEHTSELQSPCNLVCRLLLEKKKNTLLLCASFRCTCSTLKLSAHPSVALRSHDT